MKIRDYIKKKPTLPQLWKVNYEHGLICFFNFEKILKIRDYIYKKLTLPQLWKMNYEHGLKCQCVAFFIWFCREKRVMRQDVALPTLLFLCNSLKISDYAVYAPYPLKNCSELLILLNSCWFAYKLHSSGGTTYSYHLIQIRYSERTDAASF